MSDLVEMIRLVDGLDNLFVNNEIVLPRDVPPEISSQYMWAALLKNTCKNIELYLGDADGVRDAIRMASAVAGSEQELVEKPIIHFLGCIGQPLTCEKSFLEGFVEAATRKIPLAVQSGPAAGATGPATLAGTLALANAEILIQIIIAQIITPSLPVIYTNWARTFDMKAENVCFSSPEFALMRIAVGQLAQRYNVPLCQGGFQVDSKTLDVQAGYERYVSLVSVLAGSNLILGTGMMDGANIVDPLNFIIDDEIAASYSRIMNGIRIDEETLAFDVIKSVGPGPGHNFLGTEHTFRHYRKENWLDYKVAERRPWALWMRDGGKDARERAKQRAIQILKTHTPEALPASVQADLDKIVKEAEKRILRKQGS